MEPPTNGPPKRTRMWVAVVFGVLTLLAATLAGAEIAAAYFAIPDAQDFMSAATSPTALGVGFITYAVPIVAILSIHEAGHWLVLRRYRIPVSLPILLPLPPPLGFTGTLGAVIGVREAMPSRTVALRMAIAGPLFGLVAAVIVLAIGLVLTPTTDAVSTVDVSEDTTLFLQTPFLYDVLAAFFHVPETALVHPLAFAGWWGLLLTLLQLFPVGQLDGGHVAGALLGENARWLSYAAAGLLLYLGLTSFPGYAVLAAALALGGLKPAMPVARDRLQRSDWVLVATALAVFAATFVTTPVRFA